MAEKPISIKKPSRLLPIGHICQAYGINVPPGTEIETIMDPTYWSTVAPMMRQWDRITVMPEDQSWIAEVVVRHAERNQAHVHLLYHQTIGAAPDASISDTPYEVKWGSPTVKFRVLNRNTGAVVRDMFQTREQAEDYVRNKLRALAS